MLFAFNVYCVENDITDQILPGSTVIRMPQCDWTQCCDPEWGAHENQF